MRKPLNVWMKEMRIEKGFTQSQLAEKLGLEHSQEIAAFESGRVVLPPKLISKLSQAFGVPKEKVIKMVVKIKEEQVRKIVEEN